MGKGRLTEEERSVRDPNIALKRLPAEREERRLSFFWGTFGGQTFNAPSRRSAEKKRSFRSESRLLTAVIRGGIEGNGAATQCRSRGCNCTLSRELTLLIELVEEKEVSSR